MTVMHTLRLTALAAASWALVACEQAKALEEIPSGTQVTVATKDGHQVTGALVAVNPDVVSLRASSGGGRIRVERGEIQAVQPVGTSAKTALREVVVPAGTTVEVTLDTAVASNTSRVEDVVTATIASPLAVGRDTVVPSGSRVLGTVTAAQPAGRVQGRAQLGLRFDQIQSQGVTYDVPMAPLRWAAGSTKGADAAKIGIGAAAGAVIGGITGGKKGAAIGTAVGAGGGTAVVMTTKGNEIHLNSGARLTIRLAKAWQVTVRDRD